MRVIAGIAKGRQLKAPSGQATRPTSDMVRGALFNILTPWLIDSRVLDLFAGTGALGIEALSRGAASAIFVESGTAALSTIKRNLELCQFSPVSQVVGGEVQKVAPRLRPPQDINIVFMDPPYHQGLVEQTLTLISSLSYLAPDVIVAAEHHRKENIPEVIAGFERTRLVTHGDTSLSFFRKRGNCE